MSDPDRSYENKININPVSLIIFCVLTIPMLLFMGMKTFLTEDVAANTNGIEDIQKVLHISDSSLIYDRQREIELKKICDEFLSASKSRGFTAEDIIKELKQHN